MYYIQRKETLLAGRSTPYITWVVKTKNPNALYEKVIELNTKRDALVWLKNYQNIEKGLPV
jgi:hypothetical protein